jgi:hypothetical protein
MTCKNCGNELTNGGHVCTGLFFNRPKPTTEYFLYWYQELETSKPTVYNSFLTHTEAVETFRGKYKYGLVRPLISI